MGNDPNRETAACGHPALNAQDQTQSAEAGDGYATRHDPFVYFHSVIDNQTYCDEHVVALGVADRQRCRPPRSPARPAWPPTCKKISTTPAFSFITPNLCDDGHDYPCTNQPSGASALADIDTFLQTWVPKITSSPAFKKDGLLEITFDESDGPQSDASSCCGEQPGPGTRRCRASPVRAAGWSARCCCRRSSRRAPSARRRTTTTPRWRAGRRCSGCRAWPTPQASRPPSARTCSRPRIAEVSG